MKAEKTRERLRNYPYEVEEELRELERLATIVKATKKFENTIAVDVWGKDWCDDDFTISEINGFSYNNVTEMIESLQDTDMFDDLLQKHKECTVILKPIYTHAQIGNYPPPNIESEAYWEFEIVEVIPFEEKEGE